ncbi:hypothetical protein TeGR_g2976 [Tetraparma gracilis]|uniref:Uncharacterized protein n=1 Tax=Tetraparma gracilis TaxID=2962635 RepID=A0ABQ6M3H5_9STRA|nr:hypothetical protein TeGR_g2976 [Tetraparma gracilis]
MTSEDILDATSCVLHQGENVPIIGAIFKLASSLVGLIKEKGNTDDALKEIFAFLLRINPILLQLKGKQVNDSIMSALRDLEEAMEDTSRHVAKWLARGYVYKLITSFKFGGKFREDLATLKEHLGIVSTALNVDTNIEVHKGFDKMGAKLEALNSAQKANKERKGKVRDRRKSSTASSGNESST